MLISHNTAHQSGILEQQQAPDIPLMSIQSPSSEVSGILLLLIRSCGALEKSQTASHCYRSREKEGISDSIRSIYVGQDMQQQHCLDSRELRFQNFQIQQATSLGKELIGQSIGVPEFSPMLVAVIRMLKKRGQ